MSDRFPALRQLVHQLDRSQWAPADAITASQFSHLSRLVAHCHQEAPSFAKRLTDAGLRPVDLEHPAGLALLPPLGRRDLQTAGAAMFCQTSPREHGQPETVVTSGSTGQPVVVRRTPVSFLFSHAMAMRELLWHERDLSGRLCAIRANVAERSLEPSWGPPATAFAETGPLLLLPIATDVQQLFDWLVSYQPTLLVVYPSVLRALVDQCRRHPVGLPHLRQVLSISETLPPDVRLAAETTLGVQVADCYSSQEVGYIASQCPLSGAYHVMDEHLLVEVLDRDGVACGVGQIGRVVVTDLHNYATPLIRYDIGDFVEVAPPCPCGRGLTTWSRVLGRERNLIVMPDGSRRWPMTGFLGCRDVAPVLQYQFVQDTRETIEARLVVERPLTRAEEDGLVGLLHAALGHPFAVRFSYREQLYAAGSGKLDDFVCSVADASQSRPRTRI
jgi:phenylacetate-CoA ligase